MRNPDRTRLGNARTANGGIFQLDRANPFATRFDNILHPVGDLHCPIGVQDRYVACVEPLIGIHGVSVSSEITLNHPRPSYLKASCTFAVARQYASGLIHGSQLHPKRRTSLLADNINLFIEAQIIPVRCRRAHGANRRCLGHPPRMGDTHARLHQPFDHRARGR